MNSKQIERAIQKSAKKAIAEGGIHSSRSGSKELQHLTTRLASQSLDLTTAQNLGQQLGQKIVELSQSRNKSHLDKGTIRTLILTKSVPSVDGTPIAQSQPVEDAEAVNGEVDESVATQTESIEDTEPQAPVSEIIEDAPEPDAKPEIEAEEIENEQDTEPEAAVEEVEAAPVTELDEEEEVESESEGTPPDLVDDTAAAELEEEDEEVEDDEDITANLSKEDDPATTEPEVAEPTVAKAPTPEKA